MTGIPFLIVFVAGIALMIGLISRVRVHPFLAILAVSVVLGLLGGVPLTDGTDAQGQAVAGIASVVGSGFSGTFSSIGIVIIFGALIGTLLEKTGAALKLADMVVRLVGDRHPELAIEIMGWVVSIPVFCDSGFVVLDPIRKALVKRTNASSVAMTVCLSAGLYASHVFMPPTPGPIAAANTLGLGSHLLLIMGLGALCSVPALTGAYFYARWIGKRIRSGDEHDRRDPNAVVQTYEQLRQSYGRLPGGFISASPILVPIALMAMGNISSLLGWTGAAGALCEFFGTAIVALAAGVVLAIVGLTLSGRGKELYALTNETLKTVGPILFVTAAGSVLGKVISATSLVTFISDNARVFQRVGIFFPFIIAAVLKSAQGSSTVAITTTAGIMAPLMGALGMDAPAMGCLCVIAIGAGAMCVSHANDSYFWVVVNFGAMTPEQGYKTQTAVTAIEALCAMALVFVLSLML